MRLLQGKHILIVGLINDKSIAAGIAEAVHREGGELAFSAPLSVNSTFRALTQLWAPTMLLPCDMACDQSIIGMIEQLQNTWTYIDAIVHTSAYSPIDELSGHYHDVLSVASNRIAEDITASNLGALAKAAMPLLQNRCGNLLTVIYSGAHHTLRQNITANVRYLATSLGPQGIRVNGIMAGPIKDQNINVKNLDPILVYNKEASPLRKNINAMDVGNTAAFLISDLAASITGEIVHVDAGFHITTLVDTDN